MARRKKSGDEGGQPAWLVTFSDLMTLLLTFFVLLLSMAVIDERAKRVVLGSITKRFGMGESIFNPMASKNAPNLAEPGVLEQSQEDMAALRDTIFDDAQKDLDFQENKYVQILSINADVLFKPGGALLTHKGIELLDKFLPYFQDIQHPLLVAGHTSTQRDEEGYTYRVQFDDEGLDSTWLLSFQRAMAVYRHLTSRGIPPQKLMLEAFGQYHPRYSNNTPEGRRKNRRVDIVLDKRNTEWIRKMKALEGSELVPKEKPVYDYKGFSFDLTMPGTSQGPEKR